MEKQEWLATLKAGDEVAIKTSNWSGSRYHIARVDKITPSGRIVVGIFTFLPNGQRYGGNGFASIEPVTDEIKQDIQDKVFYARAYKLIEAVDRKKIKLDMEQLKQIVAIIKKEK